MSLWGRKLQEMARALCVVALLFLNFAHVPLAAGGEVVAVPIAAGFCGNPLHGPIDAKGNPCQACRLSASADLPPRPSEALSALEVAHQVHYTAHRPAIVRRVAWRNGAQRAPPALV